MELYPAIDLRGGRTVRLFRGDFGQETVYDTDPVAVARGFEEAGARWLHVVDLDAARTGRPENRSVVAAIAEARGAGLRLQVGGGVRDQAAAAALADVGVDRVVLGTAAVEDPDLVKHLAQAQDVAVGLDVRGTEVAVRGWQEGSGLDLLDLLARFDDCGVAAFVITDISRDGTFAGPNLDCLTAALEVATADVIASGGVGSIDDLRTLAALEIGQRRLAGAIVGKAIHDGLFTVEEAIAACAASA